MGIIFKKAWVCEKVLETLYQEDNTCVILWLNGHAYRLQKRINMVCEKFVNI